MNNARDARGRAAWREEVIYCNSISYLYFSPDYYVQETVFQRGSRGREAVSASLCRPTVGVGRRRGRQVGMGWEDRQSGRGDERIWLWFKSKVLTDEKERCLTGLSPSVWQRSPLDPFSFLHCSDVICFKPFDVRLSLGHMSVSSSHLFTFSDPHIHTVRTNEVKKGAARC